MLGVGRAWYLGGLRVGSDRACQRESNGTNLGKRGVERRVLAQCNDETLGILHAIEPGNQ